MSHYEYSKKIFTLCKGIFIYKLNAPPRICSWEVFPLGGLFDFQASAFREAVFLLGEG